MQPHKCEVVNIMCVGWLKVGVAVWTEAVQVHVKLAELCKERPMLSPRSMATTGPTAGSALVYKILVMGDLGVGKTSIIRRAIHGAFPRIYKATVSLTVLTTCRWSNLFLQILL